MRNFLFLIAGLTAGFALGIFSAPEQGTIEIGSGFSMSGPAVSKNVLFVVKDGARDITINGLTVFGGKL